MLFQSSPYNSAEEVLSVLKRLPGRLVNDIRDRGLFIEAVGGRQDVATVLASLITEPASNTPRAAPRPRGGDRPGVGRLRVAFEPTLQRADALASLEALLDGSPAYAVGVFSLSDASSVQGLALCDVALTIRGSQLVHRQVVLSGDRTLLMLVYADASAPAAMRSLELLGACYHEAELSALRQSCAENAKLIATRADELRAMTAEVERLKAELSLVHSSMSWRLASKYQRVRHSVAFVGAFHRGIKRIVDGPDQPSPQVVVDRRAAMQAAFREFAQANAHRRFAVVYSAVKYVESEGQRSVRFAQAMLREGFAVLYLYWNWSDADRELQGEVEPGLFCMAKSDFLDNYDELLGLLPSAAGRGLMLLTVPDPAVLPAVVTANSGGLTTIYDILDDWEEFHRLGEAPWFDRDAELFALRNCSSSFAVTQALVDKFKAFRVRLLPNGFDPSRLVDQPAQPIKKGSVTIGYFGYLTRAWFDWDLIIDTAKSHPGWTIQILGYGMPADLKLPGNVEYVGRVHPNQLSGYVKNWDVCLIPFKAGELAGAADPIKLYEYLYFRKPVVITGMPHLSHVPGVVCSDNVVDRFTDAIKRAACNGIEEGEVARYLEDKTWAQRAAALLSAARVKSI